MARTARRRSIGSEALDPGLWIPVSICLIAGTLMALQAMGRLHLPQVTLLLFAVLTITAILRPAWLVLLLIAIPPGVIAFVPMRYLILVVGIAVVAHMVRRGRIFLEVQSGVFALGALALLAILFTARVNQQAVLGRESFRNILFYYVGLMLLTYGLTRTRDLELRRVVIALLISTGGTALAVLYLSGFSPGGIAARSTIEATGAFDYRSHFGYMMVMGFCVAFAWALQSEGTGSTRLMLRFLLPTFFLAMTGLAFTRGAWLIALIAMVVIPLRTQRRAYWLLVPVALLVLFGTPIARDRLSADVQGGVREAFQTGDFATGRWGLWNVLWDDASTAMPFGRGYGYAFSLSPEVLFGFEGEFTNEGSFVYPHNDLLFWTLEFGLIGAVLFVLFWWQLLKASRHLSKRSVVMRPAAITLGGVMLTMFIAELVDNGIFMRNVAERFFLVAGFLCGLAALTKDLDEIEDQPVISEESSVS